MDPNSGSLQLGVGHTVVIDWRLSLPLFNNMLPGTSTSEVTTLWCNTNLFIITILWGGVIVMFHLS